MIIVFILVLQNLCYLGTLLPHFLRRPVGRPIQGMADNTEIDLTDVDCGNGN